MIGTMQTKSRNRFSSIDSEKAVMGELLILFDATNRVLSNFHQFILVETGQSYVLKLASRLIKRKEEIFPFRFDYFSSYGIEF